jgi:hypothetical protein
MTDGWAEQRRRAVRAHAAADAERRAGEAARARALIADFVRTAADRDLRPVPLLARGYRGRGGYRTGLLGWYLTPDRTIAVGTDGEYYVLTVVPSIRGRLTGVRVEPQEPRLIVGEGGRDGESMPLAELLRMRLDAGS